MVAKSSGLGRECDQFVTPVANWVFEPIRMPMGITQCFLDDIANQIKLYRDFLKIDKQENSRGAEDKVSAGKIRVGLCAMAKDLFVPPLLYLRSEGYAVESFGVSGLKTMNGKFHCIVVWADQAVTPALLKQCTEIAKYYETPPKTGQSQEAMPVIAFLDEAAPLYSQKEKLTDMTIINKVFDLRELDTPILNALEGRPSPRNSIAEETKIASAPLPAHQATAA
jgi:hypothetical protein